MKTNHTTVLIVGAGPTGLTMAVELQRRGIPFRIIDKAIHPVPTSNALAVQTRTLHVWKDQGLLDNALTRGNKIIGANVYSKDKKIAHFNFENLPSNQHFILAIPQHETESMLIEHLQKQQIQIELETELTELRERAAGITATLRHADGQTEIVDADWIIGCDGGHSVARAKANIDFLGRDLIEHFVLADVKMISDLEEQEFYLFLSEQGLLILLRYNKEYSRIIAEVTNDPELKGATSMTYEQVKRLTEKRCPFLLEFAEPVWTSGFWIHKRIASEFRRNHIFLAGDAAHTHSPAGGQGMNTGIQDAYNLAWKLALVIQEKAHPIILESYFLERGPIAKDVLRKTTILTKIMSMHNRWLSTLRNFVLHQTTKIAKIRQKIASNLTELAIRYPAGILVKDCLATQAGPKVGTLVPMSLSDYTNGIEHYLLMFSGENTSLTEFISLKSSLEQKYRGLIKFILINPKNDFTDWNDSSLFDENSEIHREFSIKTSSLYLIRPDKYIGFRGSLQDAEQLILHLQKIFV